MIVHLWECHNTEFIWELKCNFVKVAASRTVHLRQCSSRELPLYYYYSSLKKYKLPPFHMPLPCLPSSFRMCLLFTLFILPLLLYLYFMSVFATHSVPLLLSCSHYFYSTACTYKPSLSLYHSRSPVPFLLLFFPGFVVAINLFL